MELSLSQWKKVGISLIFFVLAIDLLGNFGSSNLDYPVILANPQDYSIDIKLFIIRFAAYLLFVLFFWFLDIWKKKKASDQPGFSVLVNLGLIIVTIIDLGLYRYNFESKIQTYFKDFPQQSNIPSLVEPLVYQNQRQLRIIDENILAKENLASTFQPVTSWVEGSFIQFDRCIPYAVSQQGYFDVYSSSLQVFVDTTSKLRIREDNWQPKTCFLL
jgi:hypothetical protein